MKRKSCRQVGGAVKSIIGVLLTVLAVGCGGGVKSTQPVTENLNLAGNWVITISGSSNVVINTSLVSSNCYPSDGLYGDSAHGFAIPTVNDGSGCFTGDEMGQGSISATGSLLYPAHVAIIGLRAPPYDTVEADLLFIEGGPSQDYEFYGIGTLAHGVIKGTAQCTLDTTNPNGCSGKMSGTFTANRR